MDYVLLLASAFGAISLYLVMPRGRESLVKLGSLIGILTLGASGIYLFRWAVENALPAGSGNPGVFFYIFGAIALVSAVAVISHPRPIYSALYFVLLTLSTAGLFLMLQAEFIAVVLVIIYAGAILVTYVFVIMLASPAGAAPAADYDRISADPLVAILVSFTFLGTIIQAIFYGDAETNPNPFFNTNATTPPPASYGDMQHLGLSLYSQYAVPLELAGVLLTISLIGTVIIARKNEPAVHMLGSGDVPSE
ncbi:MAG TPA: NADH-quinone oxidoreductase subunit J [Phycisphaerae bacterium]|nr:NADH-quinone oxidoreductase subunit J [Phycisphaerae bacterium]